ncbi:hypothetical protein [Oleiharenicola sp. Vm1]|uniref:hypothetical protein n=1 Tax=Oleiharenicola sp. Vm1 TaxID=3398393 RepID=UPI0039F4A6F4
MKVTSLALAFFCTLLSGCGSAVVVSDTASGTAYDKSKIVADDFASRAPVASLSVGAMSPEEARKRFSLWRGGPFFRFEEGPSYFRTILLPSSSRQRRLEISSYYSKDFPTTLFVPALRFLDSTGALVDSRRTPEFKIVNGLSEHIQVSEPIPAVAAYVVIYTTPERVSQRMDFMTYSMTGVLPAPSFATHNTGFGGHYEGILKVVIKDEEK